MQRIFKLSLVAISIFLVVFLLIKVRENAVVPVAKLNAMALSSKIEGKWSLERVDIYDSLTYDVEFLVSNDKSGWGDSLNNMSLEHSQSLGDANKRKIKVLVREMGDLGLMRMRRDKSAVMFIDNSGNIYLNRITKGVSSYEYILRNISGYKDLGEGWLLYE